MSILLWSTVNDCPAATTPLFTVDTIALLHPKAPVKYLEVSLFPRTPDPKQVLFVSKYSPSFDSTNLPPTQSQVHLITHRALIFVTELCPPSQPCISETANAPLSLPPAPKPSSPAAASSKQRHPPPPQPRRNLPTTTPPTTTQHPPLIRQPLARRPLRLRIRLPIRPLIQLPLPRPLPHPHLHPPSPFRPHISSPPPHPPPQGPHQPPPPPPHKMALQHLPHHLPHRRHAPLPLERVQHLRPGIHARHPTPGAGPCQPEEAAEAARAADSSGVAAAEGEEEGGAEEGLRD